MHLVDCHKVVDSLCLCSSICMLVVILSIFSQHRFLGVLFSDDADQKRNTCLCRMLCLHVYACIHACMRVCVCVCVCACVSEIVFSCTVGDCQVKLQLRCSRHALTFRKVAERFPFLPLMLISLCWCFLMWLLQFTTVQRLGALPQN